MLGRRDFLKLVGAGTLALGATYVTAKGKWMRMVKAAVPGGTLDSLTIPKFQTHLLIPPVMPRAGTVKNRKGKPVDLYEISMRQFSQQILPAGFPKTTVWGYGSVKAASKKGLLLHNAPSLTIEARANRPVRIKWLNELMDGDGKFLPHLLPVDPTLHWANPAGGMTGRDTRPKFDATPESYRGPVPIVSHLHGAVGVGEESDGYPEAWFLPAAKNIPAGYATEGTWYSYFAGKALAKYNEAWGPGFATFEYPNANRASTIWYHDHTLGMTRLNVYAGPAGFYIIRGGAGGDNAVLDRRYGTSAIFPGPAPRENDKFPPNKRYYEIPIAIQDRAFNADGSLFYPDTRAFFDQIEGPYIPETEISPIWNPEFFGNTIIVNGNTWPTLDVEQRRYRFRLLNGCQSRVLILDFSQIHGVEVWQVGNEGGFLPAPVNLSELGNRLLLGLAERADIIVDFTNVPAGKYILGNLGPDEPFGGGEPGSDFDMADPNSTGQIMQFSVGPAQGKDSSTPPAYMVLPPVPALPAESNTRSLALMEMMSMSFEDAPSEAMLGIVEAQTAFHKMWMDRITENPASGATEVWEFYNFTADAHPMHVHEVTFEVVNREAITFSEEQGTPQITGLSGEPRLPEPWEQGLKDTVLAYPGEVTRIRAKFEQPGQFVWHCHIVEHEDNEMMRPYRIGPEDPGAPISHMHP